MWNENPFLNLGLPDQPREDAEVTKRISDLAALSEKKGKPISPFVLDYFTDPDLFHALPKEFSKDDEKLAAIMFNTGLFFDIVPSERQIRWRGDTSGLLAEVVHLPEAAHSDGSARRAESGERINLDFLRSLGIDPAKVLFFRITQPSDQPKPEYYWTSDFHEVQKGLRQEISPEQRKTAIVLVSSLEQINENGGLIQDVNDDNGLSVRQIGTGSFDQNSVLATFKPSR